MARKKKKLFKKKPIGPKLPRSKPVKTYSHPTIEAELESTKKAFLELVNSIGDSELHKRSSFFSPSVKAELVSIGANLWYTIPISAARSKKSQIRNLLRPLIYRFEACQYDKEKLIKKYEQAHKEALNLLKTLSPEELNFETHTILGTTTIENVFRNHTTHFKLHESRLKKLLART